MNLRFINWYTQALGATFGVMACIYSYLKGYMITYSNIDTYFDSLWFGGVVSSYFLLPLCILTLLLAVIKCYNPDKSLENFNVGIIISTVIIGFMGARTYFTIPAIFILFNLVIYKKTNEKIITEDEEIKENLDKKELKTLLTKRKMAKELLAKNAQKQFIMDITGLTLKELEALEEEFKK